MKTTITAKRAALYGTVSGLMLVVSVQAQEPAAPRKPLWESSASVGLTLTKGNSDTLLFTANATTSTKRPKYELSFGVDGSYGENDNVKNVEAVHGFAQYNRLFSDRFYAYARVDGLHDGIADVDYRITASPGIGYYFIKEKATTFSGEVGPGGVFERQGGKDNSYVTLRVAEKFEHKINDHVRIWESAEFLPDVSDFDKYVVNAEVGVESGLTKHTNLRVYLQDTYDNQPAAGRKNNDVKLVSALAWKF